jgi:hypothetical protein
MTVVFQAGERVVWWKRAFGGLTVPIQATVLAVTPRRIKIQAKDPDTTSETIVRHVTPEHLQPLEVPEDLGIVSADAATLLAAVSEQATPRQLRLFAAACCRAEWDRFTEEASRAAVQVVERCADGLASVGDLDVVRPAAYRARAAGDIAKMAADAAKRNPRRAAGMVIHVAGFAGVACDRRTLLELLWDAFGNTPFRGLCRPGERWRSMARDCDLFGNDFRPVLFDPSWRTSEVRGVATVMYDTHDFKAMPVLADALEDAGCDVARILLHCRAGRRHARGCWVLDALLAKE